MRKGVSTWHLSDDELKQRFWEAEHCQAAVRSGAHTLHLRLAISALAHGVSSLEAQSIVSSAEKRGLLGKGAGNIVLTFAKARGIHYLQAGKELVSGNGWDEVAGLFGGELNS